MHRVFPYSARCMSTLAKLRHGFYSIDAADYCLDAPDYIPAGCTFRNHDHTMPDYALRAGYKSQDKYK